jgi:hypothetical protein
MLANGRCASTISFSTIGISRTDLGIVKELIMNDRGQDNDGGNRMSEYLGEYSLKQTG